MATVQDILTSQQSIESSLSIRMDNFEKELRSATTKTSIEDITQDYKTFRELVWSVIKSLRTQIQALAYQVDELDSQNRKNALLFSGIPEEDNEVCSATILAAINSFVKSEGINSSSFLQCHRLGIKKPSGCRPILVRFNCITLRNVVWNSKKGLKASSTVVREFLTRPRQTIFAAARRHFGTNGCWTRDGVIFVKPPNCERSRIGSMEELGLLMAKHPAVSSTSPSTTSTALTSRQCKAAVVTPVAASTAVTAAASACKAATPAVAAAQAVVAAVPVRQRPSRKTVPSSRLVDK